MLIKTYDRGGPHLGAARNHLTNNDEHSRFANDAFLASVFYSIHALGYLQKKRFNSKTANAKYLVGKLLFVGLSELHASPAVNEDTF